jgi:hypothetical protein
MDLCSFSIAYQLVDKRRLPWVIIFGALTTAVVLIQLSGAMSS